MAVPMDYLVELHSLLAKVVARLIQTSLCSCAILQLLVYGERVCLTDIAPAWLCVSGKWGASSKKIEVSSNRNATTILTLDSQTH